MIGMSYQQQLNHFFELFESAYPGGMEPERFFRDDPYALEMLYLAQASDRDELVTTAELVKRERSNTLRLRRATQSGNERRTHAEAALRAAQTDEARVASLGKHLVAGETSNRARAINLTAEETLLLSKMASGFKRSFGFRLDVDEFARNDVYARTVLKLCVTSEHDDLVALASLFFDEQGNPTRHRRGQHLDPPTTLTQPMMARLAGQ